MKNIDENTPTFAFNYEYSIFHTINDNEQFIDCTDSLEEAQLRYDIEIKKIKNSPENHHIIKIYNNNTELDVCFYDNTFEV